MNESQLIRHVKAHIAAGDKAAEKSEQHYIAAGQHLKTLKASHGGTWGEWEALLRDKIGIGKSRASELMAIGDGRTTVEQNRAESAERKRIERKQKSLRDVTENADDPDQLRSGENTDGSEVSGHAPAKETPRCTFCRKCRHLVETIIVAEDGVHAICNECVDLCANIIRERRNLRGEHSPKNGEGSPPEGHGADPVESAAVVPDERPIVELPALNADGLDIPGFLRREPRVAAS